MTTFSQTSANDFATYTVGTGATAKTYLAMSTGKEAYGFIVADAIRTLVGELQLDVEKGIPWLGTILAKRNQVAIWKHYVRKRVKAFTFVDEVLSFDVAVDRDDRRVDYRMSILTTDGEEETVSGSAFSG